MTEVRACYTQLAWTDPAAKDYSREEVDERAPMEQGMAHAVALQDVSALLLTFAQNRTPQLKAFSISVAR